MIARDTVVRAVVVAGTCYLLWTLLTWEMNIEVLIAGGVIAVAVTAATLPLVRETHVRAPTPRRIWLLARLAVRTVVDTVTANLGLARRIWSPSLPLRSGMVEVPTRTRGEGAVGAVGLITSLIVDNQVVDIDRSAHRMLYHAIAVPESDDEQVRYEQINGPVDELIAAMEA